MSMTYRCRIFALGFFFWVINTAMFMGHYPASQQFGLLHSALAGMVMALAFVPRSMIHWTDDRKDRRDDDRN
jgi:hypothetical protein